MYSVNRLGLRDVLAAAPSGRRGSRVGAFERIHPSASLGHVPLAESRVPAQQVPFRRHPWRSRSVPQLTATDGLMSPLRAKTEFNVINLR